MAKRLNAPGGGCLETGPRHVLAAQGATGSTQRGSSGSPSPSGRASMGPVVLGVRETAVLGEHRLHDALIAPGGVRRHDGQGTDAVLVRRSDRREFEPVVAAAPSTLGAGSRSRRRSLSKQLLG